MIDYVYVRPWEGKLARCPACGSTAVFTYRDQPHVDDNQATRLYPTDGVTPTLVGMLTFWKPCLSCRYRLEWSTPV